MINHAITGYACFLSCHTLRKDFLRNIRIITKKFRRKNISINHLQLNYLLYLKNI